jgi:hypothetical protein
MKLTFEEKYEIIIRDIIKLINLFKNYAELKDEIIRTISQQIREKKLQEKEYDEFVSGIISLTNKIESRLNNIDKTSGLLYPINPDVANSITSEYNKEVSGAHWDYHLWREHKELYSNIKNDILENTIENLKNYEKTLYQIISKLKRKFPREEKDLNYPKRWD